MLSVAWDEMMSCLPGRFLIAAMVFGLLSACGEDPQFHSSNARHWIPLTPELLALMQEKGMQKQDPILIRTYKQEAEFEIWKKDTSGRYALLKTFPMCRWSGQLGPKRKEGDRQAPEGYYAITPAQLNPKSNYHLSYDMGYPNAYDRAHGGTGSYLMVHGDCSSAGCYSMTDKQIEEIYALVREAQSGGQKAVQMEAFPFRFTAVNLARHRLDPNMPFWRNLKEGADRFEVAKEEPKVGVCNGRYVFDQVAHNGEATAGCGKDADPDLTAKVAEKDRGDKAEVAQLVARGTPAVMIAYEDGGQHPYFRNKVAETSRPEAIAEGPTIELYDAKGALTKKAIQASGFDEASIAAAVKTVASADTPATTAATTPANGTKRASSVAMASSGTSASAGSGTASTPAAGVPAPASSTVIAKHGASPAVTTTTVALAAPADSGAASANVASDSTAPVNKEQPFYSKLFSNLPKMPFTGSDASPPPVAAAVNVEPESDAKVPVPPARSVRLAKLTDKESARHPGASPARSTPQSSASRAAVSRSGATRKNDPDSSATQSSSPEASPPQGGASQAASGDEGVDLFSSRPTYATLPTFSKGVPTKSKATDLAPADQ